MPFSKGSPSLATVVDLFRVIPPKKRDCLNVDLDSDLGVGRPSLLMMVLFAELLIRKKFFILCGRSLELFVCREELDMPEMFRFSLWEVEELDELKSCVMLADR